MLSKERIGLLIKHAHIPDDMIINIKPVGKVTNVKLFLNYHWRYVSNNWDNKTYRPYKERLLYVINELYNGKLFKSTKKNDRK